MEILRNMDERGLGCWGICEFLTLVFYKVSVILTDWCKYIEVKTGFVTHGLGVV
tara:strand:- start:116 stop:277 length:162 start_codon:yes stop_codon:yes gene_type:complete